MPLSWASRKQDQRDPTPRRESVGRAAGAFGFAGESLPAASQKGNANPGRHSGRGSREAGRGSQVSGPSAMNGVLVVLEYRTQEGVPSWNRLSWEALAAGQELAAGIGQPVFAALPGNKPG